MHTIEIDDITLAYDTRIILKNFSAHIKSNEFIGIFGPNGAGKSTLLHAILGLLKPLQGKIQILGKPICHGHTKIGYIPQARQITLTNQLSGRAYLSATSQGFKWGLPLLNKQQQQEIDRAISLVNAETFADRPYTQLSGGERQRLLLAQALLGEPKILLLDEPLMNLDPRHQESLIELIQQIRAQLNLTVLFTSHDINPLLNIMDRVLYLANGKAALGTVSEVITTEKLSELYGTTIEVFKHEQRLFVFSKELGIEDHAGHCHHH